jgi:putative peptide zinc metalloprotease protein
MDSIKNEIHHSAVVSESLLIRSPSDGRIIIAKSDDLVGRFMEKGTLLGYVLNDSQLTARVLVTQDDMNLIQESDTVVIRFVSNMSQEYEAEKIEIRPSATDRLPTAVLGISGGGIIKTDPKDSSGVKALDKYFEIWVTLPPTEKEILVGSRVYIKFTHGKEPIIQRFERWVDQLLLRQFNV